MMNNYLSYICMYLILFITIFYKIKFVEIGKYNIDILEKDNTDSIKGLAMLGVILHHISQELSDVVFLKPFNSVGPLSVSLFFLFSGYGLMYGKLKRGNLDDFWGKRINKVFIPFVIVNVLTVLLYTTIFGKNYSVIEIIQYTIGIKLIDSVLWYIFIILLFYLLFYVIFSKFEEKIAIKVLFSISLILIIVGMIVGIGNWWYDTGLCFTIGTYLALYKTKIIEKLEKNYFKIGTISIILFLASKIVFHSYYTNLGMIITSTIFPVIAILILLKVKVSNRILIFLGNISFEMYLIHKKILNVFYYHFNMKSGINVLLCILVIIAISFVFSKFFKIIDIKTKIKKKR